MLDTLDENIGGLIYTVTKAFSSCNKHCSIYYWQDAAKRQTAGIKFTHRSKISIFAPPG